MYSIKKLNNAQVTDLAKIRANSFPAISLPLEKHAEIMNVQNEYDFMNFYGLFNEENLIGGMRLHDFKMNLLNQEIFAGGVGSVAVDLLHKKEKVALEIIKFFIYHYKERGASMVLLYPFRPDFYKKMGFGFGTSINQFKIKPCDLPKGNSKKNIKFLSKDDAEEMCKFYNSIANKTNGLMEKSPKEFKNLFNFESNKIVGFKVGNTILGYLIFHFQKGETGSFVVNDIFVSQMLFENSEVFLELMTFLNTQSDQIRYVIINTQDENFRFALNDPRNNSDRLLVSLHHECSTQGTGIMYRVISIPRLIEDLKDHNFNNINCKLKLSILDSFIPENCDSYVIHFNNGNSLLVQNDDYDVELTIDIANFSSLITCAVDLKSLYKYGHVRLSDEGYLNTLNILFSSDEKPLCMTDF
ncbi:GNAT family N-acetyltransferase [Clostridium tagluense]|uniref:GNAT family N-acetyltransferase n=1 Tax=Clostridium tagluense TaxID=360422 RepID=UPI001C0B0AF8|nr:GNAT family N-acetyltransferase [Clostridium tagluense]MBU3127867.1 GNAT family N-acetyltransferase [Clostridium tagluense]MBW9159257.1 GNAT family N-acetyltransferase [Clostridium tagluense]MCB2312949.1 GNAT family N-acetyltransferase [Clostridium tagluense]MCB2317715.1 GNAT family N-acetyltransferase [Clostridium tagluense]MCB2322450.1 GNAT family N-acetyltransferase [Clostridium tagluense]